MLDQINDTLFNSFVATLIPYYFGKRFLSSQYLNVLDWRFILLCGNSVSLSFCLMKRLIRVITLSKSLKSTTKFLFECRWHSLNRAVSGRSLSHKFDDGFWHIFEYITVLTVGTSKVKLIGWLKGVLELSFIDHLLHSVDFGVFINSKWWNARKRSIISHQILVVTRYFGLTGDFWHWVR